jgi:hypothetical protein
MSSIAPYHPLDLLELDVIDAEFTEDGDVHDAPHVTLTAIDLGAEIGRAIDVLPTDPFAGSGADAHSGAAEACIARFAAAEADVSSDDIVGLGRVSGVRFPRLGGVLFGRVDPGSVEAEVLRSAIERTILAGYHTALAMPQVAKVPVVHDDADELWEAFVPNSYRIPRRVAATTWEVCRFDDFWVGTLEQLGLEGDAVRFANGHVSALSRSIRGLSTVGMMLALAERGGRHDRLQTGRLRSPRLYRSARREMPAAPRAVDA